MAVRKVKQNKPICYPSIARLFTPSIINEFAEKGCSESASKIVAASNLEFSVDRLTRFDEFYDQMYLHLINNYRNEYVYKNVLVEKLLLGRHSLNTSFMLTEFRSDCCKADLVLLNGTSHVFEIKTQYDNLDRLETQMRAYSKQFDCTHILTHESMLDKVAVKVDDSVGLMVLSDRYTLRIIRSPRSMKSHARQDKIFDSLRKAEYINIIKDTYGFAPVVPNTQTYKIFKELFCKLDSELAHNSMVSELKKRGEHNNVKDLIKHAPTSLKALMLSKRYNSKTGKRLKSIFQSPIIDFLCFS